MRKTDSRNDSFILDKNFRLEILTWKKFRLRGKGAPSLRGGAVGDQYVTVNVVTPTGLNDRQKAALKEFAAAGDLKVNPKKKGFFDHIKDAFEGE